MGMFGGRPPTEIPKNSQPPGTLLFTQIWVKKSPGAAFGDAHGALRAPGKGTFDSNLGKKQGSGGWDFLGISVGGRPPNISMTGKSWGELDPHPKSQ